MGTEREIRIERWKKRLIPLRILISPYKNWQIRKRYQEYLQSGNVEQLRSLKDTHCGERCFIIGNGSSLRAEDLDKLKNEFTFAANRIYQIFDKTSWRPDVYMAVDGDFINANLQDACQTPCKTRLLLYDVPERILGQATDRPIFIWLYPKKYEIKSAPFWAEKTAEIPEDISLGFSDGRTVTFDAIQLAIYMGFREIYLLGIDFNYARVLDESGHYQVREGVTDYFSNKTYQTSRLVIGPVSHAYAAARQYCDTHGIIIRNATRGGKLEAFERVDFDMLFNDQC